jgi:hypothetical protein
MKTNNKTNTPTHPKVTGVGFIPIVITLLFFFGAGILHAQPIDLCTDGPVTLTSGGLDQIVVNMPANSVIEVTMLSECDPERGVPSPGLVHYSGADAPSPDADWVSQANNSPPIPLGKTLGTAKIGASDVQFTVSLDACPGTQVIVKCQ